jgi:tetratricopeptide (TPR) repeat protein
MKNSGIDKPSQLIADRANGYNYEYGKYSNADFINMSSAIYAAGAIYSTVEDMLLWNNSFRGETLLSKENKALMFTPSINKYAYGIIVNKTTIPGIEGERTLTVHTGGINGFRSIMLSSVEDEEVIIILSNSVLYNNFSLDLNPISNRIFSTLHNLPYELPKASIASMVGQKTISDTADKAIEYYRQVKSKASSDYDFSTLEGELNSLGYFLLGKSRAKDAIAIFKLNTEEFPNSWNAFDSYAEALAADQQKELAIKYYRKSLELNPDNSNATQQIEVLSKNH